MTGGETVPQLPSGTIRVPQHVVHRPFATETVVLNLRTGKYHGLNRTAGRILELLEQTGSAPTVAERLAEEYGRPLPETQRDVGALCQDLADRDLIEIDAAGG